MVRCSPGSLLGYFVDDPQKSVFWSHLLVLREVWGCQGDKCERRFLSEQIEWRRLFYRGTPKSSKNKKNTLRTSPLVRAFPFFKVAANFLEHSFGAFIERCRHSCLPDP